MTRTLQEISREAAKKVAGWPGVGNLDAAVERVADAVAVAVLKYLLDEYEFNAEVEHYVPYGLIERLADKFSSSLVVSESKENEMQDLSRSDQPQPSSCESDQRVVDRASPMHTGIPRIPNVWENAAVQASKVCALDCRCPKCHSAERNPRQAELLAKLNACPDKESRARFVMSLSTSQKAVMNWGDAYGPPSTKPIVVFADRAVAEPRQCGKLHVWPDGNGVEWAPDNGTLCLCGQQRWTALGAQEVVSESRQVQETNDQSRSDQPQLRAGESDPRGDQPASSIDEEHESDCAVFGWSGECNCRPDIAGTEPRLSRRLRDLAAYAADGPPSEMGRDMINLMLEAAVRLDELEEPAWQPIESAPKDGTRIFVARYMEGYGWIRGVSRYEMAGVIGGWISYGVGEFGELGLAHPTHWMPLPSPPHPVDTSTARVSTTAKTEHDPPQAQK